MSVSRGWADPANPGVPINTDQPWPHLVVDENLQRRWRRWIWGGWTFRDYITGRSTGSTVEAGRCGRISARTSRRTASQCHSTALGQTRGTFIRMLISLVALLSAIALTACTAPDDGSEQPHHGQTGPYIGGAGGVGF